MINSKLYESGNQIVYELDKVNRELRRFKDNVFTFEKDLREELKIDYEHRITELKTSINILANKFDEYKKTIKDRLNQEVAEKTNDIDDVMRRIAKQYQMVNPERSQKRQEQVKYDEL